MTFHVDFWVVAGTAAPVIALSSILVNGDQIQIGIDLEITTGKAPAEIPFWRWPEQYYGMFFWYIITVVITMCQAGTLFASLYSLAKEFNLVSPSLVAEAECLSIILLGLSTVRLIQQKDWAKRIEQETRARSLSSQILRHPSRRPQANAFRRATRYRSERPIANSRRARMRPSKVAAARKKDLRLSCIPFCGQASQPLLRQVHQLIILSGSRLLIGRHLELGSRSEGQSYLLSAFSQVCRV